MNTTSTRVYGLDILKALCAFCVITIHVLFPGKMGICIEALSRISVPVFFMITGFFYVDTQLQKKELAQIKRVFLLCVCSNALYFLWELIRRLFAESGQIESYFFHAFAPDSLLEWFLYNESPFAGHLWYLGAILYVQIIVYFLNRFVPDKSRRILLISSPFLLLFNIAFLYYSRLSLQLLFPFYFTRNFLFCGIPFFTLGYFLREHKKIVVTLYSHPVFLFSSTLFFSLTTIIELYLVWRFGIVASIDLFISTIFLSILVFSAFINPYWNGKMPILNLIGRKYSVYIYIFHPIVITVLNNIARLLQKYEFYVYYRPIVVFIVSTLVSVLYIRTRAFLTRIFTDYFQYS